MCILICHLCVSVCVLCLHSIGNFVVSLHVNFQCTVFTQRVYAAFGFSLPSVRALMQIIDKNTRKKKLKKNTESSTEYPHICIKKDLCASLTNLLASEIINALQGLICSWPALWLLSLLSRVITEIEIGRRGGEKRDLLYVRLYFSLVCEIYGNFILNFRWFPHTKLHTNLVYPLKTISIKGCARLQQLLTFCWACDTEWKTFLMSFFSSARKGNSGYS